MHIAIYNNIELELVLLTVYHSEVLMCMSYKYNYSDSVDPRTDRNEGPIIAGVVTPIIIIIIIIFFFFFFFLFIFALRRRSVIELPTLTYRDYQVNINH